LVQPLIHFSLNDAPEREWSQGKRLREANGVQGNLVLHALDSDVRSVASVIGATHAEAESDFALEGHGPASQARASLKRSRLMSAIQYAA